MTPKIDVAAMCRTGIFEKARDAALSECRQLMPAELELIVEAAVKVSDFAEGDKALERLGRSYTKDELQSMLRTRIKSGSLSLANMPERWGRELTQAERDEAVIIGLREHNDTQQATHAASHDLVSKDCINTLVELCIAQALPNTAKFLADKIGRAITQDEVRNLVSACKESGYEDRVHDAQALIAA